MPPRKASRHNVTHASATERRGSLRALWSGSLGKRESGDQTPALPPHLHVVVVARPGRPVRLRAWARAGADSGRRRTRRAGAGALPPPIGLAGRGGMPAAPHAWRWRGRWARTVAPSGRCHGLGRDGRRGCAASALRRLASARRSALAPLRACGLALCALPACRAGFLAVLRAEVFLAPSSCAQSPASAGRSSSAPVLRAVLRTRRARSLRAGLAASARAVFLAVLRGLAFLLVVRFFPLVFVAMASAPICSVAALDRSNGRVVARITLHWSRLAVPPGESIVFFIIR